MRRCNAFAEAAQRKSRRSCAWPVGPRVRRNFMGVPRVLAGAARTMPARTVSDDGAPGLRISVGCSALIECNRHRPTPRHARPLPAMWQESNLSIKTPAHCAEQEGRRLNVCLRSRTVRVTQRLTSGLFLRTAAYKPAKHRRFGKDYHGAMALGADRTGRGVTKQKRHAT